MSTVKRQVVIGDCYAMLPLFFQVPIAFDPIQYRALVTSTRSLASLQISHDE